MRSPLTALAAGILLLISADCVPQPENGLSGHPNPIIVRELAVSPGVITLDPSFGFSLSRGAPGVPPRQRAASVGRAAAFSLADAIVTQLGSLGYDAIRSDTAEAEAGGRALIITGVFSQINEGRRRQNAQVAVDVEIAYQVAPGAAPTRLTAFHNSARSRPGGGVNSAATAVGRVIAFYAADLARANNWPAATR